MRLLGRNSPGALDRARTDAEQIGIELVRLRDERAGLIAADDFSAAAVAELDRKIENRQCAEGVHRERIAALEAQQRRQHRQQIDSDRAAAVAATEKRIAARVALAEEVEAAARRLSEALAALMKPEDLVSDWPAELAWPALPSDVNGIKAELAYTLFALDIPIAERPARFGGPSIKAVVQNFGAALIARMEATDLPTGQRSAA